MAKKGGSTRKNCPSSTDKVKSGDAWARKFSDFSQCGGDGRGGALDPRPVVKGGVVKGLPTSKS